MTLVVSQYLYLARALPLPTACVHPRQNLRERPLRELCASCCCPFAATLEFCFIVQSAQLFPPCVGNPVETGSEAAMGLAYPAGAATLSLTVVGLCMRYGSHARAE